MASLDKWSDYTEAKEAMFFYTDTADAPWTIVKSDDETGTVGLHAAFPVQPTPTIAKTGGSSAGQIR